jgi:predicted phage terminase large subunit-like protein
MRLKLSQKQTQAWLNLLNNPEKRRLLFDGGARSGKTDVILAWLFNQAATYSGARILLARKYLSHAISTTWVSIKKLLRDVDGWEGSESDHSILLDNGSVMRCGGLDDKERVDKILGDEYLHIFVNEATQTNYETITTIMTRLAQNLKDDKGRDAVRKLILDCNPKGKAHWLHKWCIDLTDPISEEPIQKPEIWGRMHWTPYDNPYLPADFIETLEALPGVVRRRMLDGEWCGDDGGLFKREWFQNILPARPTCKRLVRAWDLAATAKTTADYTAGVLMGCMDTGKWCVLDVIRKQIAPAEVQALIKSTAAQDGQGVQVIFEQEGGASGKIAADAIIRNCAGYSIKTIKPSTDKVTRAMPLMAQAEAGNIALVRGLWLSAWLDEITSFPDGEHDDQVDATAHAFNSITKAEPAIYIP